MVFFVQSWIGKHNTAISFKTTNGLEYGVLKIAFILNDFPSITQTFVLSQMHGIIEQGHEVDIYAFRKTDIGAIPTEISRNNLQNRVVYLHKPPKGRAAKLRKLPKSIVQNRVWRRPLMFLKTLNFFEHSLSLKLYFLASPFIRNGSKKYDIIHCQFGNIAPAILQLIQVGALQGKLATAFRGHDITQYKQIRKNYYSRLFKYGDIFLPVSKSLEQLLIEAGCDQKKITVIHSGIDCHKFEYSKHQLLPGSQINILSTARLTEMKGLRYAIEAVSILIAKGIDLHYDIIGEGELRDELQNQITELGLEQHVNLLGWRSHNEVKQKLNETHIFLAPSVTASNGEKEGIPNAVKEAMAQGIPVVATRHSGIPELVTHNLSGFLVSEKDSKALADKIEHLCEHRELWSKMSAAARKSVEDNFDIIKLTDKLACTYASIC